jgi:hypothetical protein
MEALRQRLLGFGPHPVPASGAQPRRVSTKQWVEDIFGVGLVIALQQLVEVLVLLVRVMGAQVVTWTPIFSNAGYYRTSELITPIEPTAQVALLSTILPQAEAAQYAAEAMMPSE